MKRLIFWRLMFLVVGLVIGGFAWAIWVEIFAGSGDFHGDPMEIVLMPFICAQIVTAGFLTFLAGALAVGVVNPDWVLDDDSTTEATEEIEVRHAVDTESQKQFVDWMIQHDLYIEYDSHYIMWRMHAVWLACQLDDEANAE